MHSEKAKRPKGMGYPLKPMFLSDALRVAGIELDVHLIRGVGRMFFDAQFWPPNPNVQYERLYIRASAVSIEQQQAARAFMESIVIPEFIKWVRDITSLPMNSPIRREKQRIEFAWSAESRSAGDVS